MVSPTSTHSMRLAPKSLGSCCNTSRSSAAASVVSAFLASSSAFRVKGKKQTVRFFSLRCSARERFWLETASQTWRTKSFNRFQGPLTVERITTGQVRILKEGFQYKAICFFCVRFKESEGLEQANWRRNANTLSGKTNFFCIYIYIYILTSRRNPNSDKCKEEIARMLIL